jgi:hypothetical protein
MLRISNVLLIALLGFTLNCQIANLLGVGAEEDTSEQDLLFAAALFTILNDSDSGCSGGCELGNVCFSASSGITCSGGTASGTGTLTPTASSGNFVSLQLDVLLTQAGGTVTFTTGGTSSSTKQTGFVLTGSGSNQHQYFGNGGADTNFATTKAVAASTSTTQSYCFESHLDEGHVMLRSSGCTAGTNPGTDGTTDEEEGSINPDTGRVWGIILSNATISNLTSNSAETFSE